MACRFPGAKNYEEFWENLIQGRSSIKKFPGSVGHWKAYWGDPQTEPNKCNNKWAVSEEVDAFDPGFFNLSAREAELMDPRATVDAGTRLVLFEDAGICPSSVSGGKLGVISESSIMI